MQELRCRCGKIVCEIDNMDPEPPMKALRADPKTRSIVIMCRHCKNRVAIQVSSVLAVSGGTAVPRPVLQLNTR